MPAQHSSTDDIERRFGGLARLYGRQGAERIRTAHVVVVGVGGVGSWASEALARSGVGRITLVDLDHVAASNINRQAHALTDTLGQAKVRAMAERIMQIHPDCVVQEVEDFAAPGNWPQLLSAAGGSLATLPDAVIDACDQISAKQVMAAWALRENMRFVAVGAAGGKRHAERTELADLAQVTHDPLMAKLRYQLRRHHGAAQAGRRIGIPVVFSRENVCMPSACDGAGQTVDGSLNCHGYGSSVAVTASFGFCAAGWVLDQLAQASGD